MDKGIKLLNDLINGKLKIVDTEERNRLEKEINFLLFLEPVQTGNKDFDNGFNVALYEIRRRLLKAYYNIELEKDNIGYEILYRQLDELEIVH